MSFSRKCQSVHSVTRSSARSINLSDLMTRRRRSQSLIYASRRTDKQSPAPQSTVRLHRLHHRYRLNRTWATCRPGTSLGDHICTAVQHASTDSHDSAPVAMEIRRHMRQHFTPGLTRTQYLAAVSSAKDCKGKGYGSFCFPEWMVLKTKISTISTVDHPSAHRFASCSNKRWLTIYVKTMRDEV